MYVQIYVRTSELGSPLFNRLAQMGPGGVEVPLYHIYTLYWNRNFCDQNFSEFASFAQIAKIDHRKFCGI